MRFHRFMLSLVLMSLSTVAFAQSDAQKAFDQLKALEGSWAGALTTFPPQPEWDGLTGRISLRVTSMGNALMHDLSVEGQPDNPITMLYLDSDRLQLTHYCDAGNRPRMVGKVSPDGRTVEFEFLDLTGTTEYGHMHRAVFTMIGTDHHTEDWTFMRPGGKPVRAHFDLRRAK